MQIKNFGYYYSGKKFWSCSAYPECNGTRRI